MEGLDYWKLCDNLNIIQASLLIIGEDLGDGTEDYVLNWDAHKRPDGFNAAFSSLKNAVLNKTIDAQIIHSSETLFYSTPDGEESVDSIPDNEPNWKLTTICTDKLKTWLSNRNIYPDFFFLNGNNSPDYLNKNHSHYSPKLAVTIKAWEAIKDNPALLENKTPKQALTKWLREHASIHGFTDSDGFPIAQTIEDMAKVGNWNTKGGVAKTHITDKNTNLSPNQPIENNTDWGDDDIPF